MARERGRVVLVKQGRTNLKTLVQLSLTPDAQCTAEKCRVYKKVRKERDGYWESNYLLSTASVNIKIQRNKETGGFRKSSK